MAGFALEKGSIAVRQRAKKMSAAHTVEVVDTSRHLQFLPLSTHSPFFR